MTEGGPTDPGQGTPFDDLARLYLPAEPAGPTRSIEVDDDWSWPSGLADGLGAAVWGHLPLRLSSTGRMVRWAVARELALARLRRARPGGMRIVRVNRLPPVRRPDRIRNAIRRILMSGLAVELGRSDAGSGLVRHGSRVVDAVVAAAGGGARPVRLRPSGDGSALARLEGLPAGTVELRIARSGSPKNPRRNASALRALAAAGIEPVPRLVAEGETADMVWTVETALPGRQMRRPDGSLAAQARAFAATLPRRPDQPSTAVVEQLRALATDLPTCRSQLADLAAELPVRAARLGTIVEHGDFWAGNLLVQDGRLSGVIDWDTWHPDGMPGTDLLHLHAATLRRTGLDFGELWLAGSWRDEACRGLLAPYWAALGLQPTPDELLAVSTAWWASQASASLRRGRNPGGDPDWVRRNVEAVLARLRETAVPTDR